MGSLVFTETRVETVGDRRNEFENPKSDRKTFYLSQCEPKRRLRLLCH